MIRSVTLSLLTLGLLSVFAPLRVQAQNFPPPADDARPSNNFPPPEGNVAPPPQRTFTPPSGDGIPYGEGLRRGLYTPMRNMGERSRPAQEDSDSDSPKRYRVVLIGRTERVLGTYDSYVAASAAALKWAYSHPTDYSLWRIDTVKNGTVASKGEERSLEALRQAIDQAKFTFKRHSERGTISTLEEYKNACAEAYRRATQLRATMLSGTQGIMQKDFRDMNNLITELNREIDSCNSYVPSTRLERVTPLTTTIKFQDPSYVDVGSQPEEGSAPSLSGKKFSGSIGSNKADVEFSNGTFQVTGGIEGSGQWRQGGKGVHMETETSVYRGEVTENGIQGYRYFKDHRPYERWSVGKGSERPQGANVIGRWQGHNPNDGADEVEYFEFFPNGRYRRWGFGTTTNGPGQPLFDVNGPYNINGTTLTIRFGSNDHGEDSTTVSGNTIRLGGIDYTRP